MTQIAYIIRGLPGSGKTTMARRLCGGRVFEADQYFTQPDGSYRWDGSKLALAHEDCRRRAAMAMCDGTREDIAISNTSMTADEVTKLVSCVETCGYVAVVMVMDNEWQNRHNVPFDALARMARRFEFYNAVSATLSQGKL